MNRAVPQRSKLFIMLFTVLAALLSFFSPAPGMAEERVPAGPTTAGLLPDPSAVALTEIAPRAVEVSSFLRTLDTTFASSPDVQTIDESLREISRRIDSDLAGIVEPGKRRNVFPHFKCRSSGGREDRSAYQVGWRYSPGTHRTFKIRSTV